MPKTAWRIVKTRLAASAFDGEGARLHGGRWNSPGTAIVYTSQSVSLAALELLVHLQASELLLAYSTIPVDFDDELIEIVDAGTLPDNWRAYPAPSALQQVGNQWAAEHRSVVLQVPSAVVPTESNYLLNPSHPAFHQVTLGSASEFRFDHRLE